MKEKRSGLFRSKRENVVITLEKKSEPEKEEKIETEVREEMSQEQIILGGPQNDTIGKTEVNEVKVENTVNTATATVPISDFTDNGFSFEITGSESDYSKPKTRRGVAVPIFSSDAYNMINFLAREVKLARTMFMVEKKTRTSADRDRFMNNTIRTLENLTDGTSKTDTLRIYLYFMEVVLQPLVVEESEAGEFFFRATDDSDCNAKIMVELAKVTVEALRDYIENNKLDSINLVRRFIK